ncbi:imidazolonepropionase [Paracoccus pantotrophus]|uniref:Imidazolonepropionase n=1 Tax=Paracoccus pantotrophus TaxID=82367 RepID=A0AAE6NWY2_PARPN|nr:imidazolonepropionase [Paracoccus pantotrophus]QFG38014.1 imidazolonepropionase [Paracoccus pantotrophus]RKS51498.1 imidazolonepropionase [Paracoccus pantotrophus]
MQLLHHAKLVTIGEESGSYGLIEQGALVIEAGRIIWIGAESELPARYADVTRRDLGGRLVTPGLIDCHTHIVFGGDRAREFEMRLEGASYEEIARAGGGILSSVRATRAADEEALLASALPRVDTLLAEGVTTLEIKSGYGLDINSELKMLRVARRIGQVRPVTVRTTWLAAHALPPEYKDDRAGYIREVVIAGMQRGHAEGLIDAVDGFCEGIAFTREEMAGIFDHAARLGLPVKLHAEQLSDLGGAAMAAQHGALSADHLEYLGPDGIEAMAAHGTVAVLLPGAFYTLRETQYPPMAALRQAGVPIALATDCNPGTSPLTSLLLTMNMGATLFRMTPSECLAGVTRHAARALGLADRGRLAPGMRADLAVWDISHPAELTYRIGFNPLHARIVGGELV